MLQIGLIQDESGILTTQKAIEAGISKNDLYSFLQDNNYEKVGHGIYASPDAWIDEAYILSLRCPKAVFSHDEALYYYGLVDREPLRQTMTLYTGYGTARLVEDGIKIYTVKRELLDVGRTIVENSYGHMVPMYDLDRTICDIIRSRSNIEIQDFQTALKSYAVRKDKNLSRLMEYAKLFRIEKKVREYMEVLL